MNKSAPLFATQKHPYPDARGKYGEFGGKFVPETLMPALDELEKAYMVSKDDPVFQEALRH